MIAQSTITGVFSSSDIVDVLSECCRFEKRGKDFVSCCPFLDHTDSTPSFVVSPSKQVYYCFGCKRGGNVFTFLQTYHRMSFQEAVLFLASKYCIPVVYEKTEHNYLRDLYENIVILSENKLSSLSSATDTSDYFSERKIEDSTKKLYRLGYDDGLLFKEISSQYPKDVLDSSNLFVNGRDKFEGRFLFPLLDLTGRCVGLAGTRKGIDPKYLNVSNSSVYEKGSYLYGLYQAKDDIVSRACVVVVEGYFDCISLFQLGIRNVVALCGTACTPAQVKLLKRFTDSVILFLDGDSAGIKAVDSAFSNFFEQRMKVFVCVPLTGEDPDSLSQKGKKVVVDALKSSISWFDWKIPTSFPSVEIKMDCISSLQDIFDQLEDENCRVLFRDEVKKRLGVSIEGKPIEKRGSVISLPGGDYFNEFILLAGLLSHVYLASDFDSSILPVELRVLYERIVNSTTEAELYNDLDVNAAKMMVTVVNLSSCGIKFDSFLETVKRNSITRRMKELSSVMREKESVGVVFPELTQEFNTLLEQRRLV